MSVIIRCIHNSGMSKCKTGLRIKEIWYFFGMCVYIYMEYIRVCIYIFHIYIYSLINDLGKFLIFCHCIYFRWAQHLVKKINIQLKITVIPYVPSSSLLGAMLIKCFKGF